MNRKRTIGHVALITVIGCCVVLTAEAKKPVKPPVGPPTPAVTPGMVLINATEISGDIAVSGYVDASGNILFSGGTSEGDGAGVMTGRLTPDGLFDKEFGEGGIVTSYVNYRSGASSCAPQSDGKIVLSGNTKKLTGDYDWLVLGYNYDGSINKYLGDVRGKRGGKVITNFDGDTDLTGGVAIQANDKIVVTGDSRVGGVRNMTTARFTADGFLDPSFGSGGIVYTPFAGFGSAAGNEVAIHGNGVLVAGLATGAVPGAGVLIRLDESGNLDPFFGNAGVIIGDFPGYTETDFRDVAVDIDGKIVVAGYLYRNDGLPNDMLIARYDEFGNLDPTFGKGGYVGLYLGLAGQELEAVAIQDGKIVVAGWVHDWTTSNMLVMRLNYDGSLDTTFNGVGWATTSVADAAYGIDESYGYDVSIQDDGEIDDGEIVVFGKAIPHMASVVRFNSDGSLDTTFND